MALQLASLNSGSNGNCYYIGNDSEAVLIDVGISCRETEIRMRQIGLSINKVKAIFVSHEHSDHIKGVSVLANKYKIPVYITAETGKNGPRLIKHLSAHFRRQKYRRQFVHAFTLQEEAKKTLWISQIIAWRHSKQG